MTTSGGSLSPGALCYLFADRVGEPREARQRYAGLIVPSSGARIGGWDLTRRAWELTFQHLIAQGALEASLSSRRRLLVTRETLKLRRIDAAAPARPAGLDAVALGAEFPTSAYQVIFDWCGFLGEPESKTLAVLHDEVERAGLGRALQSKMGGWLHPDFMEWDRAAIARHEPAFRDLEEGWQRFEAADPRTARMVCKDVRLAVINRTPE